MARKRNRQRRRQATPSASPSRSPSPPSSSPPTRFNFTDTTALPALALCALITAAFFPALTAGFVWDDSAFTLAEPVKRWDGIAQIWFQLRALPIEVHYWPVLYSTFWLEHKLWGFNPLGYHIVNLILHATVTVLLWRLLVRIKIPGAWLAAAVFAVHPVHTEAVAWIIGRKDILAALFFLSSVWFYFNFADDRRRRDYVFALALFIVGMLAKSVVVTLPAALLVWHWWRQGRVTAADGMRVSPFIVIGAAIAVADWLYSSSIESVALGDSLTVRALIAAKALWFYAGKLLWPDKLMVIYPRWTISAADWIYPVAALALAAALWFARHRITRGPLAGALFFALVLSPALGFVGFGYMQFSFVADRYQYLAAAGVIVVLVASAVKVGNRLPKPATLTLAAVVIATLATLAWQQSRIYKNEETFYQHIIAHNPDARAAHANYAIWLRDQGRLTDAVGVYRAAEQHNPNTPGIANGMGLLLEKLNRADDAEAAYRRALLTDADDSKAMYNLALLLSKQGDYAQAMPLFERAIKINPRDAKSHTNIGVILERQGRAGDAEARYRRAVQLDPQNTLALNNLARLLITQRRFDGALRFFKKVTAIEPNNADAHADIGVTLFNLKRFDESLRSLERALALDPSLAHARANREKLLRQLGDDAG